MRENHYYIRSAYKIFYIRLNENRKTYRRSPTTAFFPVKPLTEFDYAVKHSSAQRAPKEMIRTSFSHEACDRTHIINRIGDKKNKKSKVIP